MSGVLLRTCNRIESYRELSPESVRHLFRVAAGLESQILGEWEILGQVKQAGLFTKDPGLRELFSSAVEVGTRVRRETGISRGNVSIASVAVARADRLLKGKDKKVVLIGLGKVGEAVLKNLQKRGFGIIAVAKKTFAFDRLQEEIRDADLVISSTSAPHLVLHKEQIEERTKPLIIMDLAVPRDVDPEVAEISGVRLFSIGDIKEEIGLNLLRRKIEAAAAARIVEQEVKEFCKRLELEPAAAV